MGTVRGCDIPENLYYSVELNTWVRRELDGSATIGLSAYSCALIGTVVGCVHKRPGKEVKKGRSCATLETDRWVGAARSPVSGVVIAVNEHLAASPAVINADPYGEGWLVRVDPSAWDEDVAELVTGKDALSAFEARMQAEGFAGCDGSPRQSD